MLKIKNFDSLIKLLDEIKLLKKENYYFLWEFLREIDSDNDELIIILEKNWEKNVLKCVNKTSQILPKISDIYYAAYNFENEIYDFYWKEIKWNKSHILRLNTDKKDYFPKRQLWKSSVESKRDFTFTDIKWKWNVKVLVWPIHAWIIWPWHFRFICDWDDVLNLDIQLGWTHRWIENFFTTEKDITKLLNASWDIVWNSRTAYSINFAKCIEKAWKIKISKKTVSERIIALELERINNYLLTLWGMLNDVWQWFLLNSFLSIRENFLNLFDEIYNSRTLKWVIWIWKNNVNLNKKKSELILKTLKENFDRFNDIYEIWRDSTWVYDRFKDTWIVKKDTAYDHWALWFWAKASWIYKDSRVYDEYYKDIKLKESIWEDWDVLDRYVVMWEEILQSIDIIKNILENDSEIIEDEKNGKTCDIKLNDWLYVESTEWHIWEVLMTILVENNEISYFKIKDPSFVNWTLLEYAVLHNIIADFPICNKSFNLSYSWFDL